jgi:hypothetical protein
MGHAQRELSGQAPNQASNSERAGAGDHERTSRLKGTKPIRCWVTLVVTDMQPSRTPELQGGYSQSGVLPDAPLRRQFHRRRESMRGGAPRGTAAELEAVPQSAHDYRT